MRVSQYLSISGSEYLSRSLLRSIVFSPSLSHSLSLPLTPSPPFCLSHPPLLSVVKKKKRKKTRGPRRIELACQILDASQVHHPAWTHKGTRQRVCACVRVFVRVQYILSLSRARARALSLSSSLPLKLSSSSGERETHKHRRTAPLGIDGVGADVCQGQGG